MSTGRSGWGDPPDATALELVGAAAEACPDAPFLDFEGEVATYGAFATLVSSYATGIASSVRSGDRVVAMLDNSLEAVALWMATNVAGAIYIPLNTSLKGAWLDKQVELSEPSLIVCEDDYAGHFAAYIGQSDSRRFVTRLGETFEADGTVVTPEAIAGLRGSAPPTSLFAAPPVDISAVTFTSGTTAASKGCMLSPQYICNMARHILTFTERQPDEVCWTSLPLFHLNAMSSVVATAMLRGTLSVSKRFSLSGFWPAIERSNAKVVQMLGSMPWLVANASDEEAARRCYGQVRVVVGAPINAEVGARLRERFGVRQIASQVYGSTEASCLTYFPCSETAPNGSSGRRHDDFDVRIFDEADREVPSGEVGEIVFRPLRPNVMFNGYWRAPEEAVKRLGNLWWHTGDRGYFDENDFLFFADRDKDTIRRRGEMVATLEVEDCLSAHPDVLEASVHGVTSEFGDDEVKATIVTRLGHNVEAEALVRFAAEQLPYFAVPRYIEFRDHLPHNELGRVLKRQLRDEGVTLATWDREAAGVGIDR